MQYTYLLIMIFTLSYPLYKSFENNVNYVSKWKYVLKSTLPVALFFIIWDNWFTYLDIWQFNPKYVLNYFLFFLPLEEYMFFFFVPFSCIFIHEVMYYFVKKDILKPYATLISWGIIGISTILLIVFFDRLYPRCLFSLIIVTLLAHLYLFKSTHMGRFYLSFAVCILPFLIVNGLLTALPVITYNKNEIMNLYIYTIPLEDLFYGMLLLLVITSFYEFFKTKSNSGTIQ